MRKGNVQLLDIDVCNIQSIISHNESEQSGQWSVISAIICTISIFSAYHEKIIQCIFVCLAFYQFLNSLIEIFHNFYGFLWIYQGCFSNVLKRWKFEYRYQSTICFAIKFTQLYMGYLLHPFNFHVCSSHKLFNILQAFKLREYLLLHLNIRIESVLLNFSCCFKWYSTLYLLSTRKNFSLSSRVNI